MSILLTILLVTVGQCEINDTACWRRLYDQESDKTALLQTGYEAAKKLAETEGQRAELWKKTALENAPKRPSVVENPVLWAVVGLAIGAATAIAVTYAVNQPRGAQ
jgi:hypothetical protein